MGNKVMQLGTVAKCSDDRLEMLDLAYLTGRKGSFSLTSLVGVSSSVIMSPMSVYMPVRHTMTNTSSSASLGFHT